MTSDSRDTHFSSHTLAGATILQIVPALREQAVARAAVDVAYALLQSGARALVAAEDGPLVAELKALGGEWVPLVNATVNPLKLRRGARVLERLIASEGVDIVHAQSVGGAWSANMAASRVAVNARASAGADAEGFATVNAASAAPISRSIAVSSAAAPSGTLRCSAR